MYKLLFSLLITLSLFSTVSGQDKEAKKKKNKKTLSADPDAKLQSPHDIAFDEKSGLFFISSSGNHGIIKRGRRGGAVFVTKDLVHPRGVTILNSILYVADSNRVKGFNIKDNKEVFNVEVKGSKALHAITCNGGLLYVSDKEVSKVYSVNVKSEEVETITSDVPSPTGVYFDKKSKDLLILSSLETAGGVYSYSPKNKTTELKLQVVDFPYLEDITFNGSLSYYITAWGADHKENVIIKINSSLSREPRIIQSSSDGPSGMIYIKRTNELAIASEYANNLNIIKLGY
ncbi:hypothetical protein [Flammeovirga sp. SJP92]|uniref:hypothetical protein n=1 Tax=Flammeovirga sp. SJP92 TaxID=1775430 RepID=UPI0007894F83|nr:hypothetical protein [Flammeovirga sp. SJP92]KXX71994.1 hypothetical protein AVL50_04210 [Flammeovirga sp. SJP92]